MVNIVEAYIKFNKQLVILISGHNGSGKMKIARFISDLFKIKLSKLSDYYYSEEYYSKPDNYVRLNENVKVLNWDNIDKSVNWDSLNTHIDTYGPKGLVIVGFNFPRDKITRKIDYHIHVKISKAKLFENREKYEKAHENIYKNDIEREHAKLIFNKITYNLYFDIVNNRSKINKWINANEKSLEQMKEDIFSYLIKNIGFWISNYNKKLAHTRKKERINDMGKNSYIKKYQDQHYHSAYDDYHHNKHRKHWDTDQYGNNISDDSNYINGSETPNSDDKSDSDAIYLYSCNPK